MYLDPVGVCSGLVWASGMTMFAMADWGCGYLVVKRSVFVSVHYVAVSHLTWTC